MAIDKKKVIESALYKELGVLTKNKAEWEDTRIITSQRNRHIVDGCILHLIQDTLKSIRKDVRERVR